MKSPKQLKQESFIHDLKRLNTDPPCFFGLQSFSHAIGCQTLLPSSSPHRKFLCNLSISSIIPWGNLSCCIGYITIALVTDLTNDILPARDRLEAFYQRDMIDNQSHMSCADAPLTARAKESGIGFGGGPLR